MKPVKSPRAEKAAAKARSAPRRSRASGQTRISDVAKLASVSTQTVSRFFRDPSVVSAEASTRIRKAADALGYVPNLVAGSLASNRSRIVAIIVPTIANPAHSVWVQGLTDALSADGYQVLLGATNYDPLRERELVRTFLGRRVDGIAITGARIHPDAKEMLTRSQTPTVQIFELPKAPIDMAIGFDNEACGARIADHFVDLGYQHLAVVGSPARADTRAAARVAGFLKQTARRKLNRPLELTAARPADVLTGKPLLAEIIATSPPIEAVFCVGTQISVGLMLACSAARVPVPGRLAIAGFSQGDLASMLTPSLTTIHVPALAMGERAGAMLLARMSGRPVEASIVDVGFDLVVGAST